MTSKYPKLIAKFPPDIVEQSLVKLEESDDAFKEFLLELCHEYSRELVYTFWIGLSAHASQLAGQFSLQNFENSIADESDAG